MSDFSQTYRSLLDTLTKTFDNQTHRKLQQEFKSYSMEKKRKLAELWHSDFKGEKIDMITENIQLIPSVQRLNIPWTKLSKKSTKYITDYFNILSEQAIEDSKKDIDIAPPSAISGAIDESGDNLQDIPPELRPFYKMLPPGLLSTVTNMAADLTKEIEDGDKTLQDLDLGQLAQRMMQNINPADLASISKKMK